MKLLIQTQEYKSGSFINTEDFSKALGVNPNTVRRGYCIQGHYMGIKPKKMPNRRLLWPVDRVHELMNRESGE